MEHPHEVAAPTVEPIGGVARRVSSSDFSVVHTVQPARFEVSAHAHRDASLCFVLSGSFRELGDSGASFRPGHLVVSPAGQDVGLRFGPTVTHCLVVEVSSELRESMVGGRAPLDLRPMRFHDSPLAGMARRVLVELHQAPESPVPEPDLEDAVQTLGQEIELRLTGRAERPPPSERALARVLEVLHASYRQPLGLSALASSAGLHRMSLARAFRRRFGRSVGEYLHILRASAAASLMADSGPERSLAEIALAVGFADQSHLSRIFKRVYGRPPGAFRRAASIVQDGTARTH